VSIKGIGIDIHSPRINGDLGILRRDLDYYAQCGFDYVEIPVHGVDAIIAGRLNERRVREVKTILAGHDFRYTVHSPDPLNLFDIEHQAWHKDVFRSSIAFAKEIGAETVVYHAGCEDAHHEKPGLSQEELKGIERESLLEMAELAVAAGVTIGVENGGRESYSGVIAELVTQVCAVAHPAVGITFDFGHAFLTAQQHGFDYLSAVHMAAPHIVHLHVHDNCGRVVNLPSGVPYIFSAPFGVGDLHMPPGWGSIPYERIFSGLHLPPSLLLMELSPRYADVFPEALAEARRLAALAGG